MSEDPGRDIPDGLPEGATVEAAPGDALPLGGPEGEATESGEAAGSVEDAAAAALQRARASARDKGLRPGLKPMRRRQVGVPNKTPRDGRDPLLLGDQMDRLLSDRGWKVDVAVGSVMGRWPQIVGEEVAQHCIPVTFELGVLTVRADSTAWTTQLKLLESAIMGRLEGEVGKGTVAALKIVGPSAPSWSKGPRRSTGPGPRDTYG
ncbi:DciA family protein [Pedococcus aerophilus]|uniref:DciA family protein n=1 Tax=Pedococcus aerophilus TaxID=436356 RepID=A0ABN3UR74_9MICO